MEDESVEIDLPSSSSSSLCAQISIESQEIRDQTIEDAEVDRSAIEHIKNKGSENRIKRRLVALSNLPIPISLPKLSNKDSVIDLTSDSDRSQREENIKWFQSKLPFQAKKSMERKLASNSKKGTVVAAKDRRALRKVIVESLALKRRAGQEKRKKLYEDDNEGILDEEEEEEEEKPRKSKKLAKPIADSDEEDADDLDYKEEEEKSDDGSDGSSEDSENDDQEVDEANDVPQVLEDGDDDARSDIFGILPSDAGSVDVFDQMSTSGSLQGPRPNLLTREASTLLSEDGSIFTQSYQNMHIMSQSQPIYPDSLSQWYKKDQNAENEDEKIILQETPDIFPLTEQKSTQLVTMNLGADDIDDAGINDELLMLCSGQFFASVNPNTESLPVKSATQVGSPLPDKAISHEDSDDEDDMVQTKKKRAVVSSDNEEEPEDELERVKTNDKVESEIIEEAEEGETAPSEPLKRRALIDSDDDSEDDGDDEEEDGGDEEEEEIDDEEENPETLKDEEAKEEDDADGDSDDEMAVMRRLENNEFKRKAGREKWFDDEASLSGDDVGSDIDENELGNEYEAEEGDNDDVPDALTIRNQNMRHLMKQQMDDEHRELVHLQDRLLMDGDLAGTETNRTFRLKLREEEEDLFGGDEDNGEQKVAEQEEEQDEQPGRVDAIKWRLEMHQSLSNMVVDEKADEAFESAAAAALQSRTVHIREKTSLLRKESLSIAVKEATGAAVPKQLYMNNSNPQGSSTGPAASTTIKRPPSPNGNMNPVKKHRASKLSTL